MRIVVAAWLAQGLILPTSKAAIVYGPRGVDAGFRSESSRLEAERWFAGKKGRSKPRFMQWARGPDQKRVLQSAVYLRDGSRLCCTLNTDDTKIKGPQRMRLILWHAIKKGLLPKGEKHLAWGLYGGPINPATKRFLARLSALTQEDYELERKPAAKRLGYAPSTIDWLTNHDEARQADPVRRARARTHARARGRKVGKWTPSSRSWQSGPVGSMLAIYPGGYPIYGQLTIEGLTLRWRLPVQNRAEGAALVKPAVDARARTSEAFRQWRECLVGSPEARTALKALLDEQLRFRDTLLRLGAKRCKVWPAVADALKEPPSFDEAHGRDLAKSWFIDLLRKNPERAPRLLETVEGRLGLLDEATKRFNVSKREARRCYERAQDITGIRAWSTAHRGKARNSAS
jgi:hypothetical protein